ncbi:MAG: helix-turn-helix transcriptional regulator [Candidatus Dormibacteraeota bacterium]|uniref:Helix-turn-helix transcriptional regulator n=1 Tax=Candidatus Amunia macphersoniae TaxID=3127014 RepID=A0A934NIL8_9BACT|nr:helix-turn-helix transcriptional regulator [Candidatus Dormibacteraeota bacterium]
MGLLVRERGIRAVVRMGGSSIYDAVDRLERFGLIEASEPSREGRRPERTVYSIAAAGRDELRSWMAELLAHPAEEYPQFAAALAFVIGAGRDQTVTLLRERMMRLEALIASGEKVLEAMRSMPRIIAIEGEYSNAMHAAELTWLRGLVDDIVAGRLWSDEELRTLFAMSSSADNDDEIPDEIARAVEHRKRAHGQQQAAEGEPT